MPPVPFHVLWANKACCADTCCLTLSMYPFSSVFKGERGYVHYDVFKYWDDNYCWIRYFVKNPDVVEYWCFASVRKLFSQPTDFSKGQNLRLSHVYTHLTQRIYVINSYEWWQVPEGKAHLLLSFPSATHWLLNLVAFILGLASTSRPRSIFYAIDV